MTPTIQEQIISSPPFWARRHFSVVFAKKFKQFWERWLTGPENASAQVKQMFLEYWRQSERYGQQMSQHWRAEWAHESTHESALALSLSLSLSISLYFSLSAAALSAASLVLPPLSFSHVLSIAELLSGIGRNTAPWLGDRPLLENTEDLRLATLNQNLKRWWWWLQITRATGYHRRLIPGNCFQEALWPSIFPQELMHVMIIGAVLARKPQDFSYSYSFPRCGVRALLTVRPSRLLKDSFEVHSAGSIHHVIWYFLAKNWQKNAKNCLSIFGITWCDHLAKFAAQSCRGFFTLGEGCWLPISCVITNNSVSVGAELRRLARLTLARV